MSNLKNKIQRYLIPSPYGYIISKYKTTPYPNATDERIRRIAKVIFNGPATIIVDIDGNKTVVQYQHDSGGYDRLVGWFTCLIKYLFNDSKKYHDIIEFAFVGMNDDETDIALETAIISQIGYKDFKECLSLPNLYKED